MLFSTDEESPAMELLVEIRISAVALLRDGAVLLVRKRGTQRFMLPGGKFDGGETPLQCAIREVREELGLELHVQALTSLGHFSAPAANEPGHFVEADIFMSDLADEPLPLAEIEELRWQAMNGDETFDLAPLLACVLPVLRDSSGVCP
jgi:8-oxo-dGTP pyrophosphatase MutT (NUDIX family)